MSQKPLTGLTLLCAMLCLQGCRTSTPTNSAKGTEPSAEAIQFKEFNEKIPYDNLQTACLSKVGGSPITQNIFDEFSDPLFQQVSGENSFWVFNPDAPYGAVTDSGDIDYFDESKQLNFVCVLPLVREFTTPILYTDLTAACARSGGSPLTQQIFDGFQELLDRISSDSEYWLANSELPYTAVSDGGEIFQLDSETKMPYVCLIPIN